MFDITRVMKHLNSVRRECGEIIDVAGVYPDDHHRFFQLTLDKVRDILDDCHALQLSIFQEMEVTIASISESD